MLGTVRAQPQGRRSQEAGVSSGPCGSAPQGTHCNDPRAVPGPVSWTLATENSSCSSPGRVAICVQFGGVPRLANGAGEARLGSHRLCSLQESYWAADRREQGTRLLLHSLQPTQGTWAPILGWLGTLGSHRAGQTGWVCPRPGHQDPGSRAPVHSPSSGWPGLPPCTLRLGRADWPVPTELDLQDLCMAEPQGEELDGLWTSLSTFIILFLLSVSYSATVTLLKVGTRGPSSWASRAGVREVQREGAQAELSSHRPRPHPQVKWVFATVLQEKPRACQDHTHVRQRAA